MFKENQNRDLVGYHIEGGETFMLSTYPPLSLETLADDKPLFLGYEPRSWFPTHLDASGYKILEITFSKPKTKLIDNMSEYSDLIIVKEFESPEHGNREITVTTLSNKGKELYQEGYRLFCLTNHVTSTGQADILEAFLMDSSKYVKTIKESSIIADILEQSIKNLNDKIYLPDEGVVENVEYIDRVNYYLDLFLGNKLLDDVPSMQIAVNREYCLKPVRLKTSFNYTLDKKTWTDTIISYDSQKYSTVEIDGVLHKDLMKLSPYSFGIIVKDLIDTNLFNLPLLSEMLEIHMAILKCDRRTAIHPWRDLRDNGVIEYGLAYFIESDNKMALSCSLGIMFQDEE